MARQSLGRGFDALMPKDLDRSILETDQNRVQNLLIQDVIPNPDQPRRDFEPQALAELAASIKRYGVLQPIIVVRSGDNYAIVAGERRWRATKAAGLEKIPAIVRSLEELEKIELSLIENIQRIDLSPLEQALSLYRLQNQFNLGLDQISQKLGKAPSTISNLIRLLQLPDGARDALSKNQITEGHARAILALKNKPKLQEELLANIVDHGWTVRQAEQFVKDSRTGGARPMTTATPEQLQFVKGLSSKLDTPVSIRRGARGGQLVIRFKTEEQWQSIIKKLNSLD